MSTLEFSPEELDAFRSELFQGFTDSQFNLAIAECKRRNLVPGQHVFFQLRNGREWSEAANASVSVKKMTKVTTVDAFRLISQRTGEYVGQGKAKFYYLDAENSPTIISEVPLPHPTLVNTPREPWACSIPIYRKGFLEPVEVVCRFDAYAVTRKQGDKIVLTDMWLRRGPEQLLKCSECAARRACFPEELGSIYLREELEKEESSYNHQPEVQQPVALVEAPKAAIVPTVNHAPATPTNEPRPGEEKEKIRTKKNVKDVKIEEVILDTVDVVGGVEDDNLKIDEPEPTVHVEIAEPEPAPTVQKMDKTLPTKEEGTEIAGRVRKLIELGSPKEALRTYIIKKAGVDHQAKVPKSSWDNSLTRIEGLMTSKGKEAVVAELTF